MPEPAPEAPRAGIQSIEVAGRLLHALLEGGEALRRFAAGLQTPTPERLDAVLDTLAAGDTPKAGTQEPGRHTSEPSGGPTTLKEMVSENHDYRGEW
jgi:hypothetical protein